MPEATADCCGGNGGNGGAVGAGYCPRTSTPSRRKALAVNMIGDTALGARRDFVKKLVARKTLPKGAATFIVAMLEICGPARGGAYLPE